MTLALFILTSAALNGARGRGVVPGGRILFAILMGVCAGSYSWNIPAGIVVASGMFLWALPGWGKYFSAFTGRDNPKEQEISWIDWIGYRIFLSDGYEKTNLMRGTLCMSLRGLYLYPMFIALAPFTSWLSLIVGLGCLLQGPAYGLMRYLESEEYAVLYAELLMGAVIGCLLSVVLLTGG